uniref:Uncharacterized protein n=1 Tax=Rhizophora mucronata TaxID=61149 RepID=A0A2P2NAT9_RHIMU
MQSFSFETTYLCVVNSLFLL